MADVGEARVEVPRVLAIQPLHAAGQVRVRRLNEQMEVVRHEATRVDAPAVSARHPISDLEEPLPIVVILEDRLSPVPASSDVIDAAGDLDPGSSWHRASVRAESVPKRAGRLILY
jgi:hypothetical protein